MGFLDSLKAAFTGSGGEDRAYWVYVRCKRCGEPIKTRIDLHNDLTPQQEGGYIVRKTLVGNQLCFERIEVTLTFDQNRRLLDRTISQGDFLTAEEYEAQTPAST